MQLSAGSAAGGRKPTRRRLSSEHPQPPLAAEGTASRSLIFLHPSEPLTDPRQSQGSKEVMRHGQHSHSQCSLPRDQCNLPKTPSGTKRFPTCPAAMAAVLLSCSTGRDCFGFFSPAAFLTSSCIYFIQQKKLATSSLPSSPSPGVQAFKEWPQPPYPPHVHLPWLPLHDAARAPLGLQPKGKSGLSKANSFIC